MKFMMLVLCALLLAGCGEMRNEEARPEPVATDENVVPAETASEPVDDANQADGDSVVKSDAGPAQSVPAKPPVKNKQRRGVIRKTTSKVVDAQKALQNPAIVVSDRKIKGNDPISVYASSYFSTASKASTLGFQQALKAHEAINGRHATYDELMEMMKTHGVEFAKIRPYEMYGYDSRTGKIEVLIDRERKAAIREELGLGPE